MKDEQMEKLEQFKKLLNDIGCDFVTSPTLIGTTILIYSETTIIHFEFNPDGKFLRTITEQYKK